MKCQISCPQDRWEISFFCPVMMENRLTPCHHLFLVLTVTQVYDFVNTLPRDFPATLSISMYEIGKFIVYMFTVHCIVYSKLLLLTSLQVYSTSDSLSWYLQVTDKSVSYYTFALLTVCFSANHMTISQSILKLH